MKKILLYVPLLMVGLLIFSCGDFGDLNVDPKRPTTAEAGYLFTSATKALTDFYTDANVNENVSRLAAQYLSQVTYTSESRYDWDSRQIADGMWEAMYRDCLTDLKEARKLNLTEVDDAVRANNDAIITIVEAFTYQLLVDCFGDVPYGEALDAESNPAPAYTDAKTIYTDLIANVQKAVGVLGGASGLGDSDPIYSGDAGQWAKLGNSLLLRMGIRLADVDATTAKSIIEAAYAGAFASNGDNATFPYGEGSVNGNPLYNTLILSGRHDYVPSNTLVDYMNGLEDPRRDDYMTLDLATESDYIGNVYGLEASVVFGEYSQLNPTMEDPMFPGELMTFSEVAFILSEAAERGMSVGGTAEEWYNAGVQASIMWWGGTETEATDYLATPAVAFTTAEGGDAMNAIAMQKWIALYNDGYQGWLEWKRFDYPVLNAPVGLTAADIPVRFKYPVNEPSLNKSNYDAAAAAIGGDALSTKVFWDAN